MQQLKSGSFLQGGKYKIEKVLGQGGFGITYLATQELLDRKVCIKEFFFKEYCERDEATSHVSLGTQSNHEIVERFMTKFLKEARTISTLNHPHIIRIYDIFKENNTAYYVMEYIEGESLAELVKQRGALPEDMAIAYIKQVASALNFVHQHSINHLDVKPANIMVRKEDCQAVLIDFGLSKQYDAQGGQTSTTPVGISHGYAPMEQYKQGGVSTFSPQTDIYALGATLYKLVTGNTPPQAMDILDEGLPSLPTSLSLSIVETIKKAMQPRKVDRPNSIDEFLSGLNDSIQKTDSVHQDSKNQSKQVEDEVTMMLNQPENMERKQQARYVDDRPKPTISFEPEEKDGKKKRNYISMLIGAVVILVGIITIAISGLYKDESVMTKSADVIAKELEEKKIELEDLELKNIIDVFNSYIKSNTRGWDLMSNFKDCNRIAGFEMKTEYLPFGAKYEGVLLMNNNIAVKNRFGDAIKWDFILEGARVGADLLILKSAEPYPHDIHDYLQNTMKAKLISTETLEFAWLYLYSYNNTCILIHIYGGGSAGNEIEIYLGNDREYMKNVIVANIKSENISW